MPRRNPGHRTTGFTKSAWDRRDAVDAGRCQRRVCSDPECSRIVPANFIACQEHWATIPINLRDEFDRSLGTPERHAAWKRIERYLAIRVHLRAKAAVS